MSKNYQFNINNSVYSVKIDNDNAKILDCNGNRICEDIKIADIYAEDENIVEALVYVQLECIEKKKKAEEMMLETLKQLGLA